MAVIDAFSEINSSIVYLEFSPKIQGATVEPLKTRLEEVGAEKFEKKKMNGFSSIMLAPYLKERKVENLVLSGGNTSSCLYETAYFAKRSLQGINLITSKRLIYDSSVLDNYYMAIYEHKLKWLKNNTEFYD